LENTSADRTAQELLKYCLAGAPWPEHLLDLLVHGGGDRALFRVVVERLGDLFEPHLCPVYADLFSEVIARKIPGQHAGHLAARYDRVRRPRVLDRKPEAIQNVFVLSRVTLGADVAITSVMLDAAKKRFSNAEIYFVGPPKSWELFAGDRRLQHVPIAYGRSGSIEDRLLVWPKLRESVSVPNSIVIDPDSRLTQLGLLPICREEDYYFFESRSYGGTSDEPLSRLASRWVAETFGVEDAKPYIRTGLEAPEFATTVSFGVGDNPAKRLAEDFEVELLKQLPKPVLLDKGAGGEEAERAERVAAKAGENISLFDGSFAAFAARVERSRLYVGYDSAGGHVAAACGVPLISIFAGFASERTFERWRPTGCGKIWIIRPDKTADSLGELLRAVTASL